MIKKHGQIIFYFSPNSRQFNFVVTNGSKVGPGSYFGQVLLHTLRASSHSYTFIADLAKGTKLKNFLVETREDSALGFIHALQHYVTFSQDSVIIIWQKARNRHLPAMATTVSVPKVLLLAEASALAFARDAVPPATACERSDGCSQRKHHSR